MYRVRLLFTDGGHAVIFQSGIKDEILRRQFLLCFAVCIVNYVFVDVLISLQKIDRTTNDVTFGYCSISTKPEFT